MSNARFGEAMALVPISEIDAAAIWLRSCANNSDCQYVGWRRDEMLRTADFLSAATNVNDPCPQCIQGCVCNRVECGRKHMGEIRGLLRRLRTEYTMCSIVDGLEDVAAVLRDAIDALSRQAPAVQVPDGMVLVPVEPTPEICEAIEEALKQDGFDAVDAAAPAATVATEDEAQGGGN